LITLVGSDLPDSPIPPDHGGLFETSLLSELDPETVDMSQLPTLEDYPGDAPGQKVNGPQRRDPSNPLFGIMGADPRQVNAKQSRLLIDRLTHWIADQARTALTD